MTFVDGANIAETTHMICRRIMLISLLLENTSFQSPPENVQRQSTGEQRLFHIAGVENVCLMSTVCTTNQ